MAGLPLYRPRGMVKDRRASRVVITQSDSDGGVQCEHFNGDVDQLDGTDYYEPPGLAVSPSAEMEGGYLPLSPDPMVLPRGARHSTTPDPPAGGAVLYGPSGGYAYFDSNGDLICEPAAGRHVKLGSGATKAVTVNGDTVEPAGGLNVWAAAVEAALLAAGSAIDPTKTWVLQISASDLIGYVGASTTKVKAE